MLLRTIFSTLTLLFSAAMLGQKVSAEMTKDDDSVIKSFMQLSHQQLFDTANYYFYKKNNFDAAMICYNLFLNPPIVKDADIEMYINAYNNIGVIYTFLSDYRTGYEYFIKALNLSEKYKNEVLLGRINMNIGSTYAVFDKYDMSKNYYLKALNLSNDSSGLVLLYCNLGEIELINENIDSAIYYVDKALEVSKQHESRNLYAAAYSKAVLYHKIKNYDSAYHYFQLSLNECIKNNRNFTQPEVLSSLANMFFEKNQKDSALFYINLSNTIAKKNSLFRIVSENYLILSKIEESKGNTEKELEYFKKYAILKDSIINTAKLGEINQLQRSYEISKTNQQIEQLFIEQQIKERTIHYQKIVLFLVVVALLAIYLQNRKLNRAYKILFNKNKEITELENSDSKTEKEKYKKYIIPAEKQSEILNKIFTVMENKENFCNPDFSLVDLAALVNYNHKYVSEIIKKSLNKNVSTFINEYRIKEAQRLFSSPDNSQYTIEHVSKLSGFQSRNTFNEAFKNFVGITPKFYIKSQKSQRKNKDG